MLQFIKIGSACHFNKKGETNYECLKQRAEEIDKIQKDYGIETVIVASGAIAFGMRHEGEKRAKEELSVYEKQSYASSGQLLLMDLYRSIFDRVVAQILPTTEHLQKSDYVRHLVRDNLHRNKMSVINYNDTVDFEQINQDNDTLASRMAVHCDAHRLIILGQYNGFLNPKGELIKTIDEITDQQRSYCNGKSATGNGGFKTKLLAGQECMDNGIEMMIGNINNNLEDTLAYDYLRTRFIPINYPITGTK